MSNQKSVSASSSSSSSSSANATISESPSVVFLLPIQLDPTILEAILKSVSPVINNLMVHSLKDNQSVRERPTTVSALDHSLASSPALSQLIPMSQSSSSPGIAQTPTPPITSSSLTTQRLPPAIIDLSSDDSLPAFAATSAQPSMPTSRSTYSSLTNSKLLASSPFKTPLPRIKNKTYSPSPRVEQTTPSQIHSKRTSPGLMTLSSSVRNVQNQSPLSNSVPNLVSERKESKSSAFIRPFIKKIAAKPELIKEDIDLLLKKFNSLNSGEISHLANESINFGHLLAALTAYDKISELKKFLNSTSKDRRLNHLKQNILYGKNVFYFVQTVEMCNLLSQFMNKEILGSLLTGTDPDGKTPIECQKQAARLYCAEIVDWMNEKLLPVEEISDKPIKKRKRKTNQSNHQKKPKKWENISDSTMTAYESPDHAISHAPSETDLRYLIVACINSDKTTAIINILKVLRLAPVVIGQNLFMKSNAFHWVKSVEMCEIIKRSLSPKKFLAFLQRKNSDDLNPLENAEKNHFDEVARWMKKELGLSLDDSSEFKKDRKSRISGASSGITLTQADQSHFSNNSYSNVPIDREPPSVPCNLSALPPPEFFGSATPVDPATEELILPGSLMSFSASSHKNALNTPTSDGYSSFFSRPFPEILVKGEEPPMTPLAPLTSVEEDDINMAFEPS